jgi:hypothetical protein
MTVAQAHDASGNSLGLIIKSFLIWTFTLTVCWLVVGFPIVFLILTAGSLFAISLQSVLPMSAVLVVAGGILSANILAILVGAVSLTAKGVHPHQVRWLRWLSGEADPMNRSVYASCPLTCERSEH